MSNFDLKRDQLQQAPQPTKAFADAVVIISAVLAVPQLTPELDARIKTVLPLVAPRFSLRSIGDGLGGGTVGRRGKAIAAPGFWGGPQGGAIAVWK
jgi:hypothetical protein